ncbi:hypothetical protein SAMN04487936_11492 [Halobacillus dabanensis]|uniref:Uncharacterized protein n=1 Tax=Halobacillus dabanensis TaxID=240302 RepID=A0A1I3ZR64_HALDA|nr:hypothetical protein [Halobacillus dabanensis]SFK46161.1 hypothetical protein SAMN04487936_11492 [Halobacillus dabanensis]
MKKVIVFILALTLSYTLVQWGSGWMLTLMYDSGPSTLVMEESNTFLIRLMPMLVLILPLVMAFYITVLICRGGEGKRWKL